MRLFALLGVVAMLMYSCAEYNVLPVEGRYSDGVVTVNINYDGTGLLSYETSTDPFNWYISDTGSTYVILATSSGEYFSVYEPSGVLMYKQYDPDSLYVKGYRLTRE